MGSGGQGQGPGAKELERIQVRDVDSWTKAEAWGQRDGKHAGDTEKVEATGLGD